MSRRTPVSVLRFHPATLLIAALGAVSACSLFSSSSLTEWVLKNGKVSRVLTFDARSGLYTKSWRDLDSPTDLIQENEARAASCKEFQVKVDDRTLTGSSQDVTLEGIPVVGKRGEDTYLEVTLSARAVPLRVVVHYQVPAGFAGVRQWLTLENTGQKTIILRNLVVSCQPLSPGPVRDRIAYGHYGEEPRETFFTGRVNDVAPLVENARTGLGLAVLSEIPGYLRRTEIGLNYWNQFVYAMYDTDLFPFERSLAPGEKFETAAASVVFYRRGTTRDPHWILPQYVEQVIAHSKNELQPEWIYNDWEPWNGTVPESISMQSFQRPRPWALP